MGLQFDNEIISSQLNKLANTQIKMGLGVAAITNKHQIEISNNRNENNHKAG